MKKDRKILRTIGTLIFSIGVLAGFFLLSMSVWGDLEASLFSRIMDAEKTLISLRCPVIITPGETGKVTARIGNPTDKDWERFTRAYISEGHITLMREIRMAVPIKAGASEMVEWDVYPEDAVYDRIVFFKVYIHSNYPYPSIGGSCGIVLIDWAGLTGKQIQTILMLFFIGFSIMGFALWKVSTPYSNSEAWSLFYSMITLAIVTIVGLGISYFSFWIIGLMFLVVAVLMIGIIIGRRLNQ